MTSLVASASIHFLLAALSAGAGVRQQQAGNSKHEVLVVSPC